MAPKRRWAAVASRLPASPEPDPHGASAMVDTGGSACLLLHPAVALLWHARPWMGATSAEKTSAAVAAVEASAPSVWGGDWNHALSGKQWTGSVAGRRSSARGY